MNYGFILNFEELPQELLDRKFEEWLEYMRGNDPNDEIHQWSEEEQRREFERWASAHFPICF